MKAAEISLAVQLATEIANHRKFQMISRNCRWDISGEKSGEQPFQQQLVEYIRDKQSEEVVPTSTALNDRSAQSKLTALISKMLWINTQLRVVQKLCY